MAFSHWRSLAHLLGAGAFALTTTACAEGGGSRMLELTSHAKLEDGIVAVWKQGGSVRLASLTDFEWDSVALFPEGTPATLIHAEIGQPALGNQKYFDNARNLIVFKLKGQPVRLVLNSAALFANGDLGRWFGRQLTLTAKAPGVGLLTLTEPGAPGT